MEKLSQREITQRYDDFARYYDFAEFFTNILTGRIRKRMLSDLKGKILEVGIGTGINLKYYPKNSEVLGVDSSKKCY